MKRDELPQPIEPALRVQGLSKGFVLHLRGGLKLPVLHEVSLDVMPGECVALVGPSGRGKSTLMKCLYGNYGMDDGSALINTDEGPVDLATASPQQIIRLRQRDLSHVSQFLRALPRVSALDLVVERAVQAESQYEHQGPPPAADAWLAAAAQARLAAMALLSRLNLPEKLWALPPATFSGGEQQRVNIARGFIVPARVLLLDEPTASLDAINRQVVIGLIEAAKARGTAVIGIFHDEEVRGAVADRCVDLQPVAELP